MASEPRSHPEAGLPPGPGGPVPAPSEVAPPTPAHATATPADEPTPVVIKGPVKGAIARGWLRLFFWLSARASWLVRFVRPLAIWIAWFSSAQLRDGAMANARRLAAPGTPDRDVRRLARRIISSFYLFCHDMGHYSGAGAEDLLARVRTVYGSETYRRVRAEKKGLIVATAHLGSFEVALAQLRAVEGDKPIYVVFQPDAMGEFERQRARLRGQLKVVEVPMEAGWGLWVRMRDALLKDEVVVLQADRLLPGKKGISVPFLGSHMVLPTGPIKLALASGAPVLPIFCIRDPDGGVGLYIEDPLPVEADCSQGGVEAAMKRLASVLEKYVGAYADQWLMIQPAWCDDQPPDAPPGDDAAGGKPYPGAPYPVDGPHGGDEPQGGASRPGKPFPRGA